MVSKKLIWYLRVEKWYVKKNNDNYAKNESESEIFEKIKITCVESSTFEISCLLLGNGVSLGEKLRVICVCGNGRIRCLWVETGVAVWEILALRAGWISNLGKCGGGRGVPENKANHCSHSYYI